MSEQWWSYFVGIIQWWSSHFVCSTYFGLIMVGHLLFLWTNPIIHMVPEMNPHFISRPLDYLYLSWLFTYKALLLWNSLPKSVSMIKSHTAFRFAVCSYLLNEQCTINWTTRYSTHYSLLGISRTSDPNQVEPINWLVRRNTLNVIIFIYGSPESVGCDSSITGSSLAHHCTCYHF